MLNLVKKSSHRNHLERYLQTYLPDLSGSILDIGSKNRRYDYLMKEKPTAIDLAENKEKQVEKGDINALSFENESFANIICLEVLEYVSTPEKAVSEMYRVLQAGGALVLSVPFMYKFHGDQLRYSESFLKDLFAGFKKVDIYSVGNAYSIILDIAWGKIKKIKFSPFRYMLSALYIPFALCTSLGTSRGGDYASGYFVIARK